MSHTHWHTFCPSFLLDLHNRNPVCDMKNVWRKTKARESWRYINLEAYLGTNESPPLNVVGSNSKIEEISFPSGTDTRVYMTLSWAFRKRARKISCSESSCGGKVKRKSYTDTWTYCICSRGATGCSDWAYAFLRGCLRVAKTRSSTSTFRLEELLNLQIKLRTAGL